MTLTLRQLTMFRAVAEFGSFTRAAERLGTVQPILSTQVRDLERELGLKLFDRTTRRVELTEGGREFLREVDGLIDGLERAVRGARDLAERRRGRLTVAAPPLLSAVLLPAVLAAFRAENPGVQVVLVDKPTAAIIAALRSGEADLGIGTFAAHVTDVARTVLARDSLVLFRPGEAAIGSPARWRDLAAEDLIALTPGSGIRTLVDHGLRAGGVEGKPAFEVDHVATALALAAAGLGVTVLPSYAGAHARLTAHPLDEPAMAREISLVSPRGRAPSPAAQAFGVVLRRFVKRLAGGRTWTASEV